MPLFESQKSRNKRIFDRVGEALLQRLRSIVSGQYDQVIYGAWLKGGDAVASHAIEHCDCVKRVWGKGNEEKALALIEVFTLPMIYRWYKAREEKPTRSASIAASDIVTLFGSSSEEAIEYFLNMETQFNYECELLESKATAPTDLPISLHWADVFQNPHNYELNSEQGQYLRTCREIQLGGLVILKSEPVDSPNWESEGVMVTEACLLLDKACEACGQPPAIDLRRIKFPLKYIGEHNIAIDFSRFPSPGDAIAIIVGLKTGIWAMFELYRVIISEACGTGCKK